MKQLTTNSLARFPNGLARVAQQPAEVRKVIKLSRLSSIFEPLESRTLMSAGTHAVPAPAPEVNAALTVKQETTAAAKAAAALAAAEKAAAAKAAAALAAAAKAAAKAIAKNIAAAVVTLAAPTGVIATGLSASQVKLSWTSSTANVSGYLVLRSTDGIHFSTDSKLTSASTKTFTDNSLTGGQAYYYEVQSYNATIKSAVSSIASAVTTLAAPSGLVAGATATSPMHLSWTDNASSATGYIVLRSTDGVHFSILSKLTTGSPNSFDDQTVLPSAKYYYEIEAITSAATSPASKVASAATGIGTPTGISTTTNGPTSVTISWTDTNPGTTGYLVYRSTGGAAFTQMAIISSGATTTWTDTTASSDTSYTYEVKATSGSATSAASSGSNITTPIGTPTGLTGTVGTAGVILSWSDTDQSAGGYVILRSSDGVHFTTLTTITGSSSAVTYIDTTTATGHGYSYQVAATERGSTSALSNTASVVTPLVAPSGLTAAASSHSTVVLNWTDNDTNAAGYTISRSTNGTTFIVIGKLTTGTAATYTDTTATSASTYYYQVQATNSVATSATAGGGPVVTPMLAPTGLTSVVSGTSIGLSWTDADSAATGYIVLRSTDGVTFTQIASLSSGTASTYSDVSAAVGTKYYYKVQAVSGTVNSAASNTVTSTIAAQSPTVPTTTNLPANSTVTITTRYGSELVITLTGTTDTVSVSQSGTTLTIVADGQTAIQTVPSAGLFIYTRGGTDGISVAQSVTVRTTIETIDTGVDTISSSSADTSVWDDSSDIFTGTATVHTVAAFAGGVSKATGASLRNPTDSGTTMAVTASLWGSGAEVNDVNQGDSGDCYFMSSLAAFAQVNAARLMQSAVDMGDGTYIVEFQNGSSPEFVRVNNQLPTTGNGGYLYAHPGSDGDIWAPIMEKAYAYYRTGANTYASISSGWMGNVYAELGIANSFFYVGSNAPLFYSMMSNDLAANEAVTFGTLSDAPNLVSGHAYTLISISGTGDNATYVVRNPWGIQGDSLENSQGYATLTFAEMSANFLDGCEATT